MAFNIAPEIADTCMKTDMYLYSRSPPSGLEDYTDGYMVTIEMTVFDRGILAMEQDGTCFGVEDDTQGFFCYSVTSGWDNYHLNSHEVSYWNSAELD